MAKSPTASREGAPAESDAGEGAEGGAKDVQGYADPEPDRLFAGEDVVAPSSASEYSRLNGDNDLPTQEDAE